MGQGKANTNSGNTWINVTGMTNAVIDFLQVGDEIRMNLVSVNVSGTVNVNASTITGMNTSFVGNIVIGSEVTVNGESRTVTSVDDDYTLQVNTNFAYDSTNKYLLANSVIIKSVTAISGNNIVVNSAYSATRTKLVYQVVPNYSSQNYSYKIVTLTEN